MDDDVLTCENCECEIGDIISPLCRIDVRSLTCGKCDRAVCSICIVEHPFGRAYCEKCAPELKE